ncbi:hypothetical protein P175DRAFT_0561282 [Aspergillus ochraceoroseus IBT 24754]|uniref:Methyltransferase domain-containing protein n=1 Tax=Aspergillus ochraceoroseus IBT 24754 TaxID=1392256 RepID=A0A2T5LL24_9EURO|nr:uncharacterized protein P175DRAFT_0561282 [Aspergillus ochraceoroseus IBT 24754]PTU16980.1 hypothetical protein P175DRAFT_0561282 [Aspergillus ochraceoroseus IBT 24754]
MPPNSPTHALQISYVEKLLVNFPSLHEPTHNGPIIQILARGCGAGTPCTQFLASHNMIKVIGNDISAAQIATARTHLPESVELVQGDMMELQFPSAGLDAVIAMYSIFHLPRDEQTVMLDRVFQWLKPGGFLLMNFSVEEISAITDPTWLGGTEGTMYWSGWGAGSSWI